MPMIAEIRQKYPQYQDMDDASLADALHRKFYSDMPRQDFDAKVGLGTPAAMDKPVVPLYAPDGQGGETNVNANPDVRAQFDATVKAQDEAKATEQAEFDATRTPLTRATDAATFAASIPVRALTKGAYGIGDAFGLASQAAGNNAKRSEQDFARANETGLEMAAAAGDVMAGVPMLNTMGAVPGQVLRTGAAAARQLPGEVKRLASETKGSMPIGSGPLPGGTPPIPTPQAPTPAVKLPGKAEVIEAGQRQNVTVPRMIAGSETQQDMAAALAGMPYVGSPVKMAYDKGLQQLGAARSAAGDTLGAAGTERAGMGAKQGILDWVKKSSDDHLKGLYGQVYSGVDPAVTRPLSATAGIAGKLVEEMKASTATTGQSAVKMVEEALKRPGGLTAQGLADLRSAVGQKIDAAKIVPDASEAAYKRLYPALTADLRETVKAAGGNKALKAWDIANREANVIASKRRRLSQIVGAKEETLSGEKVLERINSLADVKGGNLRGLRLAKEVIGEKDWGNVGAEMVSRLGTNPKNGMFSAERFLTGYGKMSDAGKAELFGPAKAALDDIAILAKRFNDLDSRFNKSNTGKVTAILKLLTNPATVMTNIATAAVNPLSTFTVGGQLGGMAAGRRMAWHLASPATAKKASNMMRAYYNAESAAARGGKVLVNNEQALASSIRAYATELARQSGSSVDEINAALSEQVKKIRSGQIPQPS